MDSCSRLTVYWQCQVDSLETMREAAKQLHELGPRYVVVKGGHLIDEVKDEDGSGRALPSQFEHSRPLLTQSTWHCRALTSGSMGLCCRI